MGIIIAPILLIAFAIGVYASIKIIALIRERRFHYEAIFLGFAASLITFAFICFILKQFDSIWGLLPPMLIPIIMVIFPMILYLLLSEIDSFNKKLLHNAILVSIVFSFIMCFIFNETLFNLLELLEIEKIY